MGKKAGERKKQDAVGGGSEDDDGPNEPSEKRREKSRVAAKTRRDQENLEIFHLSQLLPLPEHVADNLDKSAILRLSLGYIRLKAFLGCGLERQLQFHHPYPVRTSAASTSIVPSQSRSGEGSSQDDLSVPRSEADAGVKTDEPQPRAPPLTTSAALLTALQGFLMIVAADGSIIYISSNIQSMLGLREVDLVGNNLLDFVHTDDHDDVQAQLAHLRREEVGGEAVPSSSSGGEASSSQVGNEEQRQPVASSSADFPSEAASSSVDQAARSFQNSEELLSDECSFAVRMKSFLDKRAGPGSRAPSFELVRMIGRYVAPKMNPTLAMETTMSLYSMVLLCRPIDHSQTLENQATSSLAFQSRFQLDLKYIDCDPRAESFTGYEADDLVGRSLYELVHPEDSIRLRNMHSKLLDGAQTMTIFMRIMLRHNEQLWVQMIASINKNPRNGKPLYITAVNYIVSHENIESQYHILDDSTKQATADSQSSSLQRQDEPSSATSRSKDAVPKPLAAAKQPLTELPPHILAMLHTNPSVAGEIVVDAVQRMSAQGDTQRTPLTHPQNVSLHTGAPKRPKLGSTSSAQLLEKADESWLQERPSLLPLQGPRSGQPLVTRSSNLPTVDSTSISYANELTATDDWIQCLAGGVSLGAATTVQPDVSMLPQHFPTSLQSPSAAILPPRLEADTPSSFTTMNAPSTHLLTPEFPPITSAPPCTPPPLVAHTATTMLPARNDAAVGGFLQQILAMQPMLGDADFYSGLLDS